MSASAGSDAARLRSIGAPHPGHGDPADLRTSYTPVKRPASRL